MVRLEGHICTAVDCLVKSCALKPAHLLFYILNHACEVRPEFALNLPHAVRIFLDILEVFRLQAGKPEEHAQISDPVHRAEPEAA